ncbi:Trehalase [Maioricimonas rarisocia]|uniref:Trehalase n=1 Tax=Maioricimonas rarisocia TaxID=2528026 RepID=A0A517Z5E7_9PLAN|nr:glycoside hydrolase family 15 protein [Maioricimonas rarisocia]QDU37683.1 Trehalase [Maioricimonas rarisocia]
MEHQYPPISDYGLIGNGQSAALVRRNGSIDWCCWPRFDSPAIFCRILDANQGGYFRLAPSCGFRASREYVGPTNVLATTFTTDDGAIRVTDLMPAPRDDDASRQYPHRILRLVEGLEGSVELECEFFPTFDYARTRARYEARSGGAIAYGEDEALSLVTPVALQEEGRALLGQQRVTAGDRLWFVVTHGPTADAEGFLDVTPEDAQQELEHTLSYWKDWIGQCRYEGPYRGLVIRSALVLKLLVFQPTGGLVAAPTTSLPDEIGGERNWDYRFTWLRDSGLVLDALQLLGFHQESMQFIDWLQELGHVEDGHLRVVYRVDGTSAPTERALPHLEGYRQSQPVRVGNAAVEQTQVDVYGQVLDAVILCFERMPRRIDPELWELLTRLADQAAAHWQTKDRGPWEMRGEPQHYVYTKLYCWVGLDRAIRFAEDAGLDGNVDEWKRQRDAVRDAILERGYDPQEQTFTQTFENRHIDASVLPVGLSGILPPDDDRIRSTVERVREELSRDGLVYRYGMDDGLPGRDATFTLCSYWLVMNLARLGELEDACRIFDRICGHANDLGLLSEQIDAESGQLLGNFPQGFAHLGLIRAALAIAEADRTGRSTT